MTMIPLSQPDITDAEVQAVVEVLRSHRLSIGPRQEEFEAMIAARAGRRFGVAVSSGTAGLHALMAAMGIGPGDEVITTPFSFVATANCALMVGATPRFVDIDPRSLNMDPAQLEAAINPRTKAIIAVEVFGNPTHMDRIASIARQHEVTLIEDCCEALGGQHKGKPVGSFGRAGVFAFYPNKQITTGEGGMIVTDDDHLARLCKSLRNQGRAIDPRTHGSPGNVGGSWLSHERLGYNFRLSEIAAALGIAQMHRLDEMLEMRRRVAATYVRKLMDCPDIILPNVEDPSTMSWFVFVLRLSSQYGAAERDRIMAGLHRHEVGAANYFPCIHLQPFYRQQFGYKEGDFPVAESISQRTIALPFYNRLEETTINHVVATLKHMISREQLARP